MVIFKIFDPLLYCGD